MARHGFNVYLSDEIMRRVLAVAQATERTPPRMMSYLVRVALSGNSVPVEWTADENGQRPVPVPAGTTVGAPCKTTFRAEEDVLVQIDNFRADNQLNSFSEALRILMTTGLRRLEEQGCGYCLGEQE